MQKHALPVRIAHWLMALSIVIMIGSGWRIYNASPIFPFSFPIWMTLGGNVRESLAWHGDPGVATAIAWHLAGMWLLGASFPAVRALGPVLSVISGVTSCRSRRDPSSATSSRRRCSGWSIPWAGTTPCKKPSTGAWMALITVMIVSGIAIWKPVQTYPLLALFGGFQTARLIHFLAMSGIVAFLAVHLALVALVPSTLIAMVTGRFGHEPNARGHAAHTVVPTVRTGDVP